MAEFIGAPDIKHVAQPPDSELCFPAIISAVSGASITESHEALMAARLSGEDGSTNPIIGAKRLEVGGLVVAIDPFQSPFEGAEDPEGVIGLIDEQLTAARAVALYHKKNDNPGDERHHWSLLTGYFQEENGGQKLSMRVIDPLRKRHAFETREHITAMIRRSMDFMGVFAYALSTTRPE